jgi:hypothetical protein
MAITCFPLPLADPIQFQGYRHAMLSFEDALVDHSFCERCTDIPERDKSIVLNGNQGLIRPSVLIR